MKSPQFSDRTLETYTSGTMLNQAVFPGLFGFCISLDELLLAGLHYAAIPMSSVLQIKSTPRN